MSQEEEFLSRDDAKKGVYGELERRYAHALFKVATEKNIVREIFAEVRDFQETIKNTPLLRRFLVDKRFDDLCAEKAAKEIANRAGMSEIVQNFIALVARNARLSYLEKMLSAFVYEVVVNLNQVVAEVGSAVPLTQEQKERIRESLSEEGRRVVLHTHVDPSLFGGFVVRVGDRLYDASLKSRLLRLHYAMKGAA